VAAGDQFLTETGIRCDSPPIIENPSNGTSSQLSLSAESDNSSRPTTPPVGEIDSGMSSENLECDKSVYSVSSARSSSSSSVTIDIEDDDQSSWSETGSCDLVDDDDLQAGDEAASVWKRVFVTLRKVYPIVETAVASL
jgi:hypothetical protein